MCPPCGLRGKTGQGARNAPPVERESCISSLIPHLSDLGIAVSCHGTSERLVVSTSLTHTLHRKYRHSGQSTRLVGLRSLQRGTHYVLVVLEESRNPWLGIIMPVMGSA